MTIEPARGKVTTGKQVSYTSRIDETRPRNQLTGPSGLENTERSQQGQESLDPRTLGGQFDNDRVFSDVDQPSTELIGQGLDGVQVQVLGDQGLGLRQGMTVGLVLAASVVSAQALGQTTRLESLGESLLGLVLGRFLSVARLVGREVVVHGVGGMRRVGRSTGHLLFSVLGTKDRDLGEQEFPSDGARLGVVEDGPDGDLRRWPR